MSILFVCMGNSQSLNVTTVYSFLFFSWQIYETQRNIRSAKINSSTKF